VICRRVACYKPVKARGLCSMHYSRWQRDLEGGFLFNVVDEIPRQQCQVRGCDLEGHYEVAGFHGTFWVCSHDRALYRTHARIVERIRSLR